MNACLRAQQIMQLSRAWIKCSDNASIGVGAGHHLHFWATSLRGRPDFGGTGQTIDGQLVEPQDDYTRWIILLTVLNSFNQVELLLRQGVWANQLFPTPSVANI